MSKLATYMIVWSLKKMKAERNVCEFWRIAISLLWGLDLWKIEVRSLTSESFSREKTTRKEKALKFCFKESSDEKLT